MSVNLNPQAGIERTKAEVTQCVVDMEKAKRLLTLCGHDCWPDFIKLIGGEADQKHEALLRMDLEVGRTTALRAEVWALRRVMAVEKQQQQVLLERSERLKGLREKLAQWQNRGREGLDAAINAADRIQTPQGVTTL